MRTLYCGRYQKHLAIWYLPSRGLGLAERLLLLSVGSTGARLMVPRSEATAKPMLQSNVVPREEKSISCWSLSWDSEGRSL
jgi:hypothetical protein